MPNNPRWKNGALRRKYRARFKAMDAPCHICQGLLGPILWEQPSDARHPLSGVIDEIKPISLWRQHGYASPAEAAAHWDNVAPAHRICNQWKGNKENFSVEDVRKILIKARAEQRHHIPLDGDW